MNRVGARACNGDDRCPLDERNFADARIFSSFNKHRQRFFKSTPSFTPTTSIELFLESSSLTIQISDVEAFFKYFKNRTNYFTDDIFFYDHHYFLKCVLPFRLLISSFYLTLVGLRDGKNSFRVLWL